MTLKELSDAAPQGLWTIEDVIADDLRRPTRFPGPCVVYADEDCDIHPVADFSCNHTCRDELLCAAAAKFAVELVNLYRAGKLVEVSE